MTPSKTPRFKLMATCMPLLAGWLLAALCIAPAFAEPEGWGCGTLRSGGQVGPFDYLTDRGQSLRLVETSHFLPGIEALVGGNRELLGQNIDYTLRAYPNHHRALIAMMRLSEKQQRTKPVGSNYSIDCWFQRAVLFRRDDTTVRMLYATYLYKNNRQSDAIAQLGYATSAAKDSGFTHYNIGMVYFDMKLYDKALVSAHRALELGFDRTELRDRLKSVDQWKEPSVIPAPAN